MEGPQEEPEEGEAPPEIEEEDLFEPTHEEEPPLYRYWLRVDETEIAVKKLPESFPLGDDSQSVLHEEFSIGREKENIIRLPEVEVSKTHARILRNSIFFRSSYCLVDIGSKNGTFLNGKRLGEGAEQPSNDVQPLQPGDHVAIGSTTLVFERAPLPPPPQPANELPRSKTLSQLKREYRPTRKERQAQALVQAQYADRAASRRTDYEPAPGDEVAVPALPRHNVGYRMLSSMGWQAGSGLGTRGEGRQTPVSTDSNRGHSGLGYGSKRGKSS